MLPTALLSSHRYANLLAEILSFHPRMHRITNTSENEVEDIFEIIDEKNRKLISRILTERGHPVTRKVQLTRSLR